MKWIVNTIKDRHLTEHTVKAKEKDQLIANWEQEGAIIFSTYPKGTKLPYIITFQTTREPGYICQVSYTDDTVTKFASFEDAENFIALFVPAFEDKEATDIKIINTYTQGVDANYNVVDHDFVTKLLGCFVQLDDLKIYDYILD